MSIFGGGKNKQILERVKALQMDVGLLRLRLEAIETNNRERHRAVMATGEDIVKQLNEAADKIAEQGAAIDIINAQVGKVAGETNGLQVKIAELKAIIDAGGTIGPELVAAANRVSEGITSLSGKTATLQATTQAHDDQVPDPTAPPA